MMSPDGNVSTKLSSTASRNYVLVKSQLTVEEYMRYREYWEKVVLGLCCEAQQTTNRLTV